MRTTMPIYPLTPWQLLGWFAAFAAGWWLLFRLWQPGWLLQLGAGRYAVLAVLPLLCTGAVWASHAAQERAALPAPAAPPLAEEQDNDYPLQVFTVGIVLNDLHQHQIWQALKQSDGMQYVLKEKLLSGSLYSQIESQREDAALDAVSGTVEEWNMPLLRARPLSEERALRERKELGDVVMADSYTERRAEHTLSSLFKLADQYRDAPFFSLAGKDSIEFRSTYLMEESSFLHDREAGVLQNAKARTSAYVYMDLGRKHRIDWLRPYAFIPPEEIDTTPEERTRDREQGYTDVTLKKPNPAYTRGEDYFSNGIIPPYEEGEAEWLKPFHARYAPPTTPFKPTRWLPTPWSRGQIAMMDLLPILARVHRPEQVSLVDADGKALDWAARQAALAAALKKLQARLPAGMTIQRLFHDGGPSALKPSPYNERMNYYPEQLWPLLQAMEEVGIKLPSNHRYDLPRQLGEMGASTAYAALAIATMATVDENSPSLVAYLGQNSIMLILVEPPTAAELKSTRPRQGNPIAAPRNQNYEDAVKTLEETRATQ